MKAGVYGESMEVYLSHLILKFSRKMRLQFLIDAKILTPCCWLEHKENNLMTGKGILALHIL